MPAISLLVYSSTYKKPSSNKASYDPNKKSPNNISINNGTFTKCSSLKVDIASKLKSLESVTENGYTSEQHFQQNISITKESVACYRQGNSEGSEEYVLEEMDSTWEMLSQKIIDFSKMEEEFIADEIPPLLEKKIITDDNNVERMVEFDSEANYMNNKLKPKRRDLDMSQHVNNVKYVRWMLETIPDQILEANKLKSIFLEYTRECGSSSIVQSHFQYDQDDILKDGLNQEKNTATSFLNGFSLPKRIESTAFRIILILEGFFRGLPGFVRLLIFLVFHIQKFM